MANISKHKSEVKFDNLIDIYAAFFQHNVNIVLLLDPKTGKIIHANEAAINFYGYSAYQMLSMSIQDINILPESVVLQEMSQANSQKRKNFQFTHRLADKTLREVEVHSFPVECDKGTYLVSIINDVSLKLHKELIYDTLFFNSPYAVVLLDTDKKIVNINQNFVDLFQYSGSDCLGNTIDKILSTSDYKSYIDCNMKEVYSGNVVKQEGIRKRKDNKEIEVEILGYPVIHRGDVIGVYIIYIDITQKKLSERKLDLFKRILENISEGVVITNENGYIDWVNLAFETITGYQLKDIYKKKSNILKSGIHNDHFYKTMWEKLHLLGTWNGEIWNKHNNGVIYTVWMDIISVYNDKGDITYYIGIFKDITEKKKISHKLNELEHKDSLTKLYNRNYFLEIIRTYIKSTKGKKDYCYIMVIGIGNFKEINNTLGHTIGDSLSIELTNRLVTLVKDAFILSRTDTDEFALLIKSSLLIVDIKKIAQEIINVLRKPVYVNNSVLYVNTSIGISCFPDNEIDAEMLVRYAGIAMNEAKELIETKICFYSRQMSKEREKRFLISNHLASAIEHKELFLCYQPIFSMNEALTIIGLEALLRWNSAALGNVSPDKFIPLSESTGQIIEIGEWVFRQVCIQIDLWNKSHLELLPVSVNISVKQLEQIDFTQKIINIMKAHDIRASLIELEITESVSSGNLKVIIHNIKVLKKYGIKFSMDDFGTGFSSLGQLDVFELDKIKIDKIFIHDLIDDKKRQRLVKSIISMAESLNLAIVAEGIETQEQLDCLKKFGCQLGQGYLISKPLHPEEIQSYLKICDD